MSRAEQAPGGMGKTRLALAAGQQLLTQANRFPDAVFFVPLVALQQPSKIVGKIVQSVQLPLETETGRTPTQQLLDFLREKQLLLILDNFEHLLAVLGQKVQRRRELLGSKLRNVYKS